MDFEEFINPMNYALKQCCASKDDPRDYMCEPFQQDGLLCATNGKELLVMTNLPDCRLNRYKPSSVPNVKGVLPVSLDEDMYRGDITLDQMMLNSIGEEYDLVEIGCVILMKKYYDHMIEVTQMLGLDGWGVYKYHDAVLFVAEDVQMLIMGNITDPKTVKTAHVVLHDTSLTFSTDVKVGECYCRQHDAAMKRREAELKAKRHGNLWEVRVAKYSTFWVEASDAEEAQEFARAHCDEVDDAFDDSEIEYEGVQGEAMLDDLPDNGDCVYTVDGWMDRDEYIDTMEVEE